MVAILIKACLLLKVSWSLSQEQINLNKEEQRKSSEKTTHLILQRHGGELHIHSRERNNSLVLDSILRDDEKDRRLLHVGDMSRNITLVLENLLKDYESDHLPSHGKDEPTIITTNMLIRSMGPVSELDMDYSMDCYFRQYWRDSRLSFVGPIKSLSLSIKMLERIWRPDTYFYNGKHSYVHTITVPNKLLRINQDGDILYSMRLTVKATCPMELRHFPMDSQSCPLVLGSYAYTSKNLVYQWQPGQSVTFVPGMTLSQFDLMGSPQRNLSIVKRHEEYSILQVNFNLQRNTGYFVIQVYVPCVLIVVLSWVSFWIHREATSDRVGLGITTVLTLSTISLDSRTDLPKVGYATALDWFLLMSFFYCIATLLEFAGVHYFTKVGSGEIPIDEEDWEDVNTIEVAEPHSTRYSRKSSLICPIYNDSNIFASPSKNSLMESSSVLRPGYSEQLDKDTSSSLTFIVEINQVTSSGLENKKRTSLPDTYHNRHGEHEWRYEKCRKWSHGEPNFAATREHKTRERHTQTDRKISRWRQFAFCLAGDDSFRKQRQREAANKISGTGGFFRHVNSVSLIDKAARILFPLSFATLNIFYWFFFLYAKDSKPDF